MKQAVLLFFWLMVQSAVPAQTPEVAARLRSRYAVPKGIDARVCIIVNIPGITAPVKYVDVYYEHGKAPKVKGAGLIILPREGLLDQFTDLLEAPVQWIPLEHRGDIRVFKLVSLDPRSNWITADLTVDTRAVRIDRIDLVTRESGSFSMLHHYGNGPYPDRTEISFSTRKFSIPLKFLGRTDGSAIRQPDGRVSGTVTLEFIRLRVF